MAGSIEKLVQSIAALDRATAELAEQFHQAYSDYLKVLGQASRQQLILASYHICTQAQPDRFLSLTYNQRQHLQQTLRQIGSQLQAELLAQLHFPSEVFPLSSDLSSDSDSEALDDESLDTEDTALWSLETGGELHPSAAPEASTASEPLTPEGLASWHKTLEQRIVEILQSTSHLANRSLQQAGLLPQSLPDPLLQVASKAEMSDIPPGPPNLLHVKVEGINKLPRPANLIATNSDNDDEPSHVMHLVAVHLRLPEIEFKDAATIAARSTIRDLVAHLKMLGRDYYQKQKERAIAEAEAAWRASWHEE